MNEQTTWVLGGVSGVLALAVVGLGVQAWSSSGRIAELEARLDAATAVTGDGVTVELPHRTRDRSRVGAERRALGPARATPAAGEVADEIVDRLDEDPDAREAIASIVEETQQKRREERQQRFREGILQEIEAFSDEQGLDTPTRAKMSAILQEAMDGWTALRKDIDAGDLGWADAREEMRAISADRDSKLEELLGPDQFSLLQERLPGPGPGPRRGDR